MKPGVTTSNAIATSRIGRRAGGPTCATGMWSICRSRQRTALVTLDNMYDVKVTVGPVPQARWSAICQDCSGAIDSLGELLQGRFSKGVMTPFEKRPCRSSPSRPMASEQSWQVAACSASAPTSPIPTRSDPGWRVLSELGAALGLDLEFHDQPSLLAAMASEVDFYNGVTDEEIGGTGIRWQEREPGSSWWWGRRRHRR